MANTKKAATTKTTETNTQVNTEMPENTQATTNPETNGTSDNKTPRLTLIAALLAGDAKSVAKVLINQGRTEEEIASFSKTFAEAVSSFKVLKAEITAKEEADRVAQEQERKQKEEIRQQSLELAEKLKKEAINEMVKNLESKGIAPDMALKVATSTFGGTTTTRNTTPKERVKCLYKGTEYLVAVRGNNKDATKNAIAESGLERDEFINQYRVDKDEVKDAGAAA